MFGLNRNKKQKQNRIKKALIAGGVIAGGLGLVVASRNVKGFYRTNSKGTQTFVNGFKRNQNVRSQVENVVENVAQPTKNVVSRNVDGSAQFWADGKFYSKKDIAKKNTDLLKQKLKEAESQIPKNKQETIDYLRGDKTWSDVDDKILEKHPEWFDDAYWKKTNDYIKEKIKYDTTTNFKRQKVDGYSVYTDVEEAYDYSYKSANYKNYQKVRDVWFNTVSANTDKYFEEVFREFEDAFNGFKGGKRQQSGYNPRNTNINDIKTTLGVDDDAIDAKTLKQKWRKLMIENHPDKFTDPKQKKSAEEKAKAINNAYDQYRNYRGFCLFLGDIAEFNVSTWGNHISNIGNSNIGKIFLKDAQKITRELPNGMKKFTNGIAQSGKSLRTSPFLVAGGIGATYGGYRAKKTYDKYKPEIETGRKLMRKYNQFKNIFNKEGN